MKIFDSKILVFTATIVFVAGGGWITVETTAQATDELADKVEQIETQLAGQELTEYRMKNMEGRLEKLEVILEKMAENQQIVIKNQSAICQQTGARCQ